jgi:hypothetical protein
MKNLLKFPSYVFLLLLVFCFQAKILATKVNASNYGYTTTNATTALRNAINSPFDTIVFSKQTSDWFINPSIFNNVQNKVFIFHKGVKIKARAGQYAGEFDCLLRFNECTNLTFLGYSAEFSMNKAEYLNILISEERHALMLFNCVNITIKGLKIRNSGGDGIYIGGDKGAFGTGARFFCKDVLIEDVVCIDNYRQGMSVLSAENLTVKNCLFTKTSGILPQAGVDLEPYLPYQLMKNITFDHCSFTENAYAGFDVAFQFLNNTSEPVSIKVVDCYLKNNCINNLDTFNYPFGEIILFTASQGVPVKGLITFERCFIDGSNYPGLYAANTNQSFKSVFKDCVFKDVSKTIKQYNNPIALEIPTYDNPTGAVGNINFQNLYVSTSNPIKFMGLYGNPNSPGLADITGNITVVQPSNNGIFYLNMGPLRNNVTYTYNSQTSLPTTNVSLSATTNASECGIKGAYVASRSSSRSNYPIGIATDTTGGTIIEGDDISLLTTGIVIPTNLTSKTEEFSARKDGFSEPTETVKIKLQASNMYQINTGANNITINVINCFSVFARKSAEPIEEVYALDENENIKIFPNPTAEKLTIETKNIFENADLTLTDLSGKLMHQELLNGESAEVNISILPLGIFLVNINDKEGKRLSIHKILKHSK